MYYFQRQYPLGQHVTTIIPHHSSQSHTDWMGMTVLWKSLKAMDPSSHSSLPSYQFCNILCQHPSCSMDKSPQTVNSMQCQPPLRNQPISPDALQLKWDLHCLHQTTSTHPRMDFSSHQARNPHRTKDVHRNLIQNSTTYNCNELKLGYMPESYVFLQLDYSKYLSFQSIIMTRRIIPCRSAFSDTYILLYSICLVSI